METANSQLPSTYTLLSSRSLLDVLKGCTVAAAVTGAVAFMRINQDSYDVASASLRFGRTSQQSESIFNRQIYLANVLSKPGRQVAYTIDGAVGYDRFANGTAYGHVVKFDRFGLCTENVFVGPVPKFR